MSSGRRSLLRGLAASAAVSTFPAIGAAREHGALELDAPLAAMKYYGRIRGSRDGQPTVWYAQSTYYGQPGQDAPVPILGSEGFELVRVEFDGDNRLIETSERVTYYTDLDSGEIITDWRNVFTGETIYLQKPLIETQTIIEDNMMSAEERSDYIDIDRTGLLRPPFRQGVNLTVPLEHFATFSTSALDDTTGRRAGQRWWSGIWESFSAPVADLVNPDAALVAGYGILFGAAPWYSWLRMGDRKGTSSVRRYLTRVPGTDALPARLLAWVRENHPEMLEVTGP